MVGMFIAKNKKSKAQDPHMLITILSKNPNATTVSLSDLENRANKSCPKIHAEKA